MQTEKREIPLFFPIIFDGIDIRNNIMKRKLCKCGCGKEVTQKDWYIGHWNKGRKGQIAWNKGKRNGRQVECSYCGNLVYKSIKRLEENSNNFCDRKCYLKFHKEVSKIYICKYCGKEIVGVAREKKTFCDNECMIKYRGTEKGRTENSIRRLEQTCKTREYCDAWRDIEYKKELMKDFCEICGIKKRRVKIDGKGARYNLVNHHIDEDKHNCRPNNIMTLCRSCHVKKHQFPKIGREAKLRKANENKINRSNRRRRNKSI